MKIVYNGSIFFKQKFGGISRYYYNLAKNLIKKDINFKIVSSFYKSNFLKNLDKNFKKGIYLKRYPTFKIIEKFFQFSNWYFLRIGNDNNPKITDKIGMPKALKETH